MNDIARIIGIAISEFVQYYLLINNSLFEEQSPSKLDKHKIAIKVEKILEIKNDFETLDDTNLLVVGFKSLLRHLPMKDFQNFQELLEQDGIILKMSANLIKSILCSTTILQTP